MDASFTDTEGERRHAVMGSYGIGLGRILASALESNHDDNGIIWPPSIAPYDVHIVAIGMDKDKEVGQALEQIEAELKAHGLAVLSDDRDERPGVKFKDADLIGAPVRLTIGPRALAKGKVEMKERGTEEGTEVPLEDAVAEVKRRISR